MMIENYPDVIQLLLMHIYIDYYKIKELPYHSGMIIIIWSTTIALAELEPLFHNINKRGTGCFILFLRKKSMLIKVCFVALLWFDVPHEKKALREIKRITSSKEICRNGRNHLSASEKSDFIRKILTNLQREFHILVPN